MLKCPPDRYGGLELICWNLACGLTKLGHKVGVFAPSGSKVSPNGFLVEFGEAVGKVHSDWLGAERSAYEVYKDMLADFDVVCGHNWFGMEYLAKAKNRELKVCHVHHGGLNMKYWGRSKAPFKLNLIAISKWMQKVYRSQGFESRVCYNGINLDDYPFSENHGDRLLFVGRIDKFKQPDMAIRVAKKLSVGLDIVGGTFVQDPAYLEKIRGMCDGEQIRFYPDASHKKKVELLQSCKALLFTSKMGEPFGLCPIEAFACGAPVISTIDGATPETIKHGEVGFLCKSEEEMVDAVGRVDSVDSEKCREWAENFSLEKMTESYLERFNEILSGDEW